MSSQTVATDNLCLCVKELEKCILTIISFACVIVIIESKSFISVILMLYLLSYIYSKTQCNNYISNPMHTLGNAIKSIIFGHLFVILCMIFMRYYGIDMESILATHNISNITSCDTNFA